MIKPNKDYIDKKIDNYINKIDDIINLQLCN